MKKSKLITMIAGSTAAVAIGMSGISYAYAQNSAKVQDTFVSILASKLGVSEDKVASAIEEARITLHNEREIEKDNVINQALEDGKLTQRQVDIINEIQDIHEEDIKSHEFHTRRGGKGELLEKLKESGLKVTEDELIQLKSTLRELGIGAFMGKGMRMNW